MPKKVICIARSSYNGSAILNSILGNDEKGNGLGEIRALFCPTQDHNYKKIESLKLDIKWKKIIDGGIVYIKI